MEGYGGHGSEKEPPCRPSVPTECAWPRRAQMSVLHMSLRKAKDYTSPLPSKEELLLFTGGLGACAACRQAAAQRCAAQRCSAAGP